MDWTIPIAGIIIGWVTNILAVEMLFKPRKPIKMLGYRLPFTPGLIPHHRDKMLDVASNRVSDLVINSISQKDATESFQMFSSLIDSHWATHLFIGENAKKKLYKTITTKVVKNEQFTSSLTSLIRKQMSKYDVKELETTVKRLSDDSLKGIKILGAVIGGIVGLITMLIGGL
tara:strand:+ start:1003 stop:1521 length:519 start_codon:yes stop_codon:yes gene_type:complete